MPNSNPETDKDFLEKIREDMVGGPSIVFTRRAVVNETFIRKSQNVCKSIVGIDASQLYPFSMCQPMPTGLYTRYEDDYEPPRYRPRQNKTRSFENMVMSCFQRIRAECKIKSNILTEPKGKLIALVRTVFVVTAILTLKQWVATTTTVPVRRRPSLGHKEVERGNKRREMDKMRRAYVINKGYKVVEMWASDWWKLYKSNSLVKQHLRELFPYKLPLTEADLVQRTEDGNLLGYLQCDIEVPEHLRENFANFFSIFKITNVSRDDIGPLMKGYAEKNQYLTQPRRMLI